MQLEARTAVVTGGGQGLGRAYCTALAREGAAVVVADIDGDAARDAAAAIRAEGGRAEAVTTDVADATAVEALVATTLRTFGRLDVVVNNAALSVFDPRPDFWEIAAADWDRVMAVNLRGPFLVARACFAPMRAQGYGKIVNISSGTALRGSARLLHYVTSKAGIIGFTRALAREVGPFGIRVNAIAPGLTQTDRQLVATPPEHFEALARERALARRQMPEDLLGTLIFLSSPASDFVTGQLIVVDGGALMH